MSALKDEHMKLIEGQKWSLKMHLNRGDGGTLIHDCKAIGLTRVIETPKVNGRWGQEQVSYLVDGEEKPYTKIADALDRIIEKRGEK